MADCGDHLKNALRDWTFELGGHGFRERLERLTPPANEYGVDPYGFDAQYTVSAIAPLLWLYRKYFRVATYGVEKVPAEGPVLVVANHSGQLPFDAAMLGVALLVEKDPPRAARALVEKWVPRLPFVSSFYARLGQVVGTPENCRRLLAAGEALLVFPEGVRGLNKPYSEKYRLRAFGTGFMRLALETGAPVVPVGIVGAEEQSPSLANLAPLARLLGMPALPLTPTGLVPLPLPTRYHIHFGDPMTFTGSPDDEDAVLDEKVEKVRSAVDALLQTGVRARKHVFW
ncbi:MAG TPA: lysophospholipid acyltransferase family protein [Anaeromyxobacteraceae bacterium]|nr:lysophospholipid acyltransferase family protein [Anaeromyxobacteraceae bacterium]